MVKTSEHDLSYDEIYEQLQTIADACRDEPGVEHLIVRKENGVITIDFRGDGLPLTMRRALTYVDLRPRQVSTSKFEVIDR